MTISETIAKIAEGLNEAQTKAVLNPLNSCTKIVAGAGTGKTKIISKRFLKLVHDLTEQGIENPQSKILVITFTDKAANEMKGRIVAELEENGFDTDTGEDLWISTFHSFCIRILKKYSIEAELSPSFKMAEEKELKTIYDNLVKRIKYGEATQDILSVQNLAKLAKINNLDAIFEDIFSVIKKIKSLGITPDEFLAKSLEAVENFSACVEQTPFKFETKEDYAFAWQNHFKKYTDDAFVLDEKAFDSIAKEKQILDKFGKRKAIEYGMAQGFPENIKPITDSELLLTKVIAQIYALYQEELQNRDIADFDDLINKTILIFKQNELVRSFYQKYFKQVIVDEFQDTNGAQLELIELLLNPEYPDLTFVGDRKQSIYAFRYAQMENLEVLHQNVEKRYNMRFEPINLSINYRSTPEVLNAVNYVTQNELNLKDENLNPNPNLEYPDTSKDIKVTVIDGFENAYEQKIAEAKYIADEVDALVKRDNANFKDFAVLVKSHGQADIVEKELKKKNIPSVKKVNTGFFSEPVIKNALSALRLVKNSQDEQALFRLLKVKFSDSDIFALKKSLEARLFELIEKDEVLNNCHPEFISGSNQFNYTYPIGEMLKQVQHDNCFLDSSQNYYTQDAFLPKIHSNEVKRLNLCTKFLNVQSAEKLENTKIENYLIQLFEIINVIRKHRATLSLLQVFEKVKSFIPLYEPKNEADNLQTQNNLAILEKIIDDYTQGENHLSITGLLDYLEKISEDRNFELPAVSTEEIDAVQILTIHASKGLEFPYVFVLSIATTSRTTDKSSIIFDMQYGDKPGFGVVVNKYKGKPNPKALIYKQLWQKPRENNEALRLFYVAVSRAKKYLNVLSFEPYAAVKPVEYIQNLAEFLSN